MFFCLFCAWAHNCCFSYCYYCWCCCSSSLHPQVYQSTQPQWLQLWISLATFTAPSARTCWQIRSPPPVDTPSAWTVWTSTSTCPSRSALSAKSLWLPKPSVNEAIEALLQEFLQTKLPNMDLFCGERGAIPCDVCNEHTFKAVKSCLICLLSFCDEHLKPHQSMASFKGHKLVSPVEKLDQSMQYTRQTSGALLQKWRPLHLRLVCEDGWRRDTCGGREREERWEHKQRSIF